MRLIPRLLSTLVLLLGLAAPAVAQPFLFTTGAPDGRIGVATRPQSADGSRIEVQAADDFVLQQPTLIYGAAFTGLMNPGFLPSDLGDIKVEIYRVFPTDSDDTRTPIVPTRMNSPADVEFSGDLALSEGHRSLSEGTLKFVYAVVQDGYPIDNTVINGIFPKPSQMTGGEGPRRGWLTTFVVIFETEFILPADHYFIVPQIEVLNGLSDFLWISAARDPANPLFPGDLQSCVRNSELEPDWLRIGSDIVGDTTFNQSFSLIGEIFRP
jgi:hypothetical protein